jgi:hypothetical protein
MRQLYDCAGISPGAPHAGEAVNKQELESAANSIWRNQQMSTQSVASALLDLIVRYAHSPDISERENALLRQALAEIAGMIAVPSHEIRAVAKAALAGTQEKR